MWSRFILGADICIISNNKYVSFKIAKELFSLYQKEAA